MHSSKQAIVIYQQFLIKKKSTKVFGALFGMTGMPSVCGGSGES
ncbi:MAG: hypothetical protein SOY56_05035 [Anaerovoracaceae bacterium]|nr:hypothetical protein [Anaerovoracaceae bacterium]